MGSWCKARKILYREDGRKNATGLVREATSECDWMEPFSLATVPLRAQLMRGIEKLAETVAVTLGPRGRNVLLDKAAELRHVIMSG